MALRAWLGLLLIGLACGGEGEAPDERAEGADTADVVTGEAESLDTAAVASADTPTASPASDTAGARPRPAGRGAADTARGAPMPPVIAADTRDPGAEALRRASAVYEDLRAMQADFTMTLRNPILRSTTTSRGSLYQRSPDRLLLRFSEPEGDVIVSDGTYFWVYYPSIDPNQVTRLPAAQAGAGGVDLRAQFLGDPLQRFEYEYEGTEEMAGRTTHVLVLRPRSGEAGYESLKVWIDEADALVRTFEIREQNGSVRRFDLSALRQNPALGDELFRFTPPEGARIVERGV